MQKLKAITHATSKYLPAGSQSAWLRTLGSVRSVQFNLCKLIIVFQYILTGLVGRHGRVTKDRLGIELSDSEDEDEHAMIAALRGGLLKRPASAIK